MARTGYVYILANRRNGAIYTGVTNNLIRRLWEHITGKSTFTKRYGITMLVHYEVYPNMMTAIIREKMIKDMNRIEKIMLIEKTNKGWVDLVPIVTRT